MNIPVVQSNFNVHVSIQYLQARGVVFERGVGHTHPKYLDRLTNHIKKKTTSQNHEQS